MFCPECGKELAEEKAICPECGAFLPPEIPNQENLEDIQISFEEMEMAAQASVEENVPAEEVKEEAEETTEEVIEEETEEEAEEEAEEELEEEIETDMDADAIVAEFLSAAAASQGAKDAEEADYEEEEPAPKKQKKSRKKLWAILIPVIIVVLLAAAAGGVYLLATWNYEKAVEAQEAKEYDLALELLEKFSFYGDSQERIDELNRLQRAYQDGTAQAQAHDYVSAIAILTQLGDYRDSQELVNATLPYARAAYLMTSAEAADASALSQHPDFAGVSEVPEDPTIMLYEGAAKLFMAMADVEDSTAQASQCYSRIANIYMEQGKFEEALGCMKYLTEADAETVLAQYMTYCADEAALEALEGAVRVRATLEETLAKQLEEEAEEETEPEEETEEPEEEKITYRTLVDAEMELLAQFEEDLLYYDAQLKEAVAMYRKGLETEASALDDAGMIKDMATWYNGSSMRAQAVETLMESIDFLAGNPQLQNAYVGKAELYNAYAVLENVLSLYLAEDKIQTSDEIGSFYDFENTTGMTFNLTVYHTFLDAEGKTVLYNESEPVEIGADQTVQLTFLKPADGEEWEKHLVTWTYEITNLNN